MKCQRARRRRAARLGEQLLGAVLAEVDDAGGDDRAATASTVDRLRRGDQRDRRRVAPGARARRGDAVAHLGDARPRSAVTACAPRRRPDDRSRRRAGRRSGRATSTVQTPTSSRSSTPAAGERDARPRRDVERGRAVAVRADDLGAEPVDERGRGGRRRTRSARGGCTARARRAPGRCRRRAARRPRRRAPRPRGRASPAWTTADARRRTTSATGAQSAVSTTSGSPTRRGDGGVGVRRARRRRRRRSRRRPVHLAEPDPRRGSSDDRPRRRARRRRGSRRPRRDRRRRGHRG